MQKYFVLLAFIGTFTYLIKKDRVYVIPMILLVYSNINGLLSWEDFALKGFIKFQDYGLIATLSILFLGLFAKSASKPEYSSHLHSTPLYWAINVYWVYYIGLFLFSVLAMGNPIWPIKMGRTFLYGIVFYLICREIAKDPIENLRKVIDCLMYASIFFGLCYIAYNTLGVDLYPSGAYEEFDLNTGAAAVTRNFSGFPTFCFYFILLFVHRIMEDIGNRLLNWAGLAILSLCILLFLTRGALILMPLMVVALILYRQPTPKNLARLGLLLLLATLFFLAVPYIAEGHYLAMMKRLDEFSGASVTSAGNFNVRSKEFSRILDNVIDFNPLIGFGFTLPAFFGYQSSQYHGGSADNGYSNLLGVTGFLGITIFAFVILSWLVVNLKLQSLKAENYSKVNFIFIFLMLGMYMNGASMSYMHAYVVFMTYDLFAYAYYSHKSRSSSVERHLPA